MPTTAVRLTPNRDGDYTSDVDTLPIPLNENTLDGLESDMLSLRPAQGQVPDDSEDASSDSVSAPRKPSVPKSKAKKARKAAHQTQKSKPSLRPAKDILSRIRHDPALDQSEYVVGYHDRHSDVMEMDVSSWKGGGDFTDEEWIPQHRILYFRRKDEGDERKIWDRATRLDRLFGSGIAADREVPHAPENDLAIGDTAGEIGEQNEGFTVERASEGGQKVNSPGDEAGDQPSSS